MDMQYIKMVLLNVLLIYPSGREIEVESRKAVLTAFQTHLTVTKLFDISSIIIPVQGHFVFVVDHISMVIPYKQSSSARFYQNF